MRRYLAAPLLILGLSATLFGCYSVKYYSTDTAGSARGDSHLIFANSFFWGLVTINEVNLDGYCGKAGIRKMRSQMGGWTILANWLTAGIWSPMQVRIKCASPGTASSDHIQYGWADLDEDMVFTVELPEDQELKPPFVPDSDEPEHIPAEPSPSE